MVSLVHLVVFALFFIGSIVLNKVLLRFSKNLGVRNHGEDVIRWKKEVKPSLGGLTFFVGFLLAVIFYFLLIPSENISVAEMGIIGATMLGFFMGFADDAYDTKPFLKFLVQFSCAVILIGTGNVIELSSFYWLNIVVTFLWVIGIMNSINMLDNMDGITTVVSVSISVGLITLLIATGNSQSFLFYILISILAVLLGFLVYNWNPAKMYMGDAGSQFLGAVLSGITIPILWNNSLFNELDSAYLGKLMVVFLFFIIPLSDTTSVVINRLMKKQSPFVGGRDHTTHHLSYLGLSEKNVARVMLGISLVSIGLGLYFILEEQKTSFMAYAICGYLVVVSGMLYASTCVNKDKN